jgi:spore coat protein JB
MEMPADTRREMEAALAQASFAALDTTLYLDTHPTCAEALRYLQKKLDAAEAARSEWISQYGPLVAGEGNDPDVWQWVDEPWPWQEEE